MKALDKFIDSKDAPLSKELVPCAMYDINLGPVAIDTDDNPKDEEDLKIKTTSKMRTISKIENDPKINDNPHKKWGRPQNVNNSKTYGHTICCFALFLIWYDKTLEIGNLNLTH